VVTQLFAMKPHLLLAFVFGVFSPASGVARESVVIRPVTAEHSEMDVEKALEKIDGFLRKQGFRSRILDEKTRRGFSTALCWSKRGVGRVTTYTHTDGSIAFAWVCASTAPGSSECDRLVMHLRLMQFQGFHLQEAQSL
jgi:hypothetical protein